MAKKRLFGREAEPSEGGFVTFRRQFLLLLAVLTFYGAWLLFLWVPETRTANPSEMATGGAVMALAIVTLALRQGWPHRTAQIYVAGSLGVNAIIYRVFQQSVTLSLFGLTVLVAGLLLGQWACVATGAAATGILFVLVPSLLLHPTAPFWLFFIAIMVGVGILTGRALELVDFWERETTVRQGALIQQLRDRQGELNRTLKALDEAYASLKRANDELLVARQAAEESRVLKEQFVANVSHELRTPLNLIVGFAEIMYLAPESYDGVGWTPDLESDIREMYRAAKHLQSLIDDILDLSRIDASRLPMFRELTDVRAVIGEAVQTIAPLLKQRHLEYSLVTPEQMPQLFIDRTRIRQVMLNLLNNAVRFTDHGRIDVRIQLAAEAVEVVVHDTGVGIEAENLEHIFEEFRQADPGPRSRGGAGLGLTISRRFVEMHGGRMWAESTVGEGSTFHFTLPLPGALPETTELQHIPDRRRADSHEAPVIVVDPDPGISAMVARYLGSRRILPAESPAEAEGMIEAEHPLAIIINLPPDAPSEAWLGPVGEQSRRYRVPILRCSLPSPSWLRDPTGINDCLTKPISRESLQRVVSCYCRPGSTILIIDDDPGFVSMEARMLRSLNADIHVISAHSGAQGLRSVRRKTPDLVLLDLLMPEMDGFQVVQILRKDETLRDIPIVAVTATSYEEEALRRLGGYFTLSQAAGIPSGKVTDLLYAGLEIAKPNYTVKEG